MINAPREMALNAASPGEPTRRIQVTNLDSNSAAIVNTIVLFLDGFPWGLRVVEFDECEGRTLLHGCKT